MSGQVPKWQGIAIGAFTISAARLASAGPMVKRSPMGRISTSGRWISEIRAMSPKIPVSPVS